MSGTRNIPGSVASCLPIPLYTTEWGRAYVGDARVLLAALPNETVDLVVTSPPFPLLRKKDYGNEDAAAYTEWFLPFAEQVKRVLKPTGSFVFELGNVWLKGRPVLSLYHYETVLRLCREKGWHHIEEFAYYNPAKLPSPAEWVCKQRIRVKDSVSHLWWLAKTQEPKANWQNADASTPSPTSFLCNILEESSGPPVHERGQITNLLQIAHTESNTQYLRMCRSLSLRAHSARFPVQLPTLFIQGLTDPGDVVLDIFAGSNTSGYAAEQQKRHWLAFELQRPSLAASSFRFLSPAHLTLAGPLYEHLYTHEQKGLHLDTAMTELSDQIHMV